MPRGGARKGAGRTWEVAPVRQIVAAAIAAGTTPLEYMLNVMRDPNATEYRRDRMAMAAAPYCHAKVIEAPAGKKDMAAEAAMIASMNSDWSDDLPSAELHAH